MGESNGTPKKHIRLGMPGYGNLTAGAAQGFYRASRRPEHQLLLWSLSSSLLALNFNRLWCWALNESKQGQCDYFAMQHSDIEPEEWWLDKLIDELEAKNLDVLGVVAPLKGVEGTTSTALASDRENAQWRPLCRLTMKEIYRLPETFTSEDVGHPLMLNTGLWVCKFRREWAEQCHFEINDEICYDPKKGIYFPVNEPEDWHFSRQLHELGLRVGCTRVVKLGHRGEMVYGNTRGWGEQAFDNQFVDRSVLDDRYPPDWFPEDVDGWLHDREGRELTRLADGKDVLEIGAYCGKSTICLARTARSVLAVDPFDGRGTPAPGDTARRFRDNVERYGVADRVTARAGTSADVLPDLPARSFDLVFIDGAHDADSVRADIALSLPLLRPGGLIVFHDYRLYAGEVNDGLWNPGVTAAVGEFLAGGAELLARVDSLAVVRPPATVPALLEV
jgi:hypothetical protein